MIVVIIIASAIVAAALASAIICSLSINTTEYTVQLEGICGASKIVCISDLHGWEYGRENNKLIKLIAEQKPDAIIIAGDIITRRASEKQIVRILEFLKKLTGVSQVFFATGNHEADYMAENGMDLLDRMSKTGAIVLYDRAEQSKIAGNAIKIGAVSGRYFDGSARDKVSLKVFEEIGESGIPSIAVVHQPENILQQEKRTAWTADLYLSGHTHGGVWRVPGIGGVLAPSQGLFPEYDKGRFLIDGRIPLIINAGLSGYYFIPRVFNKPEICVIRLVPN